MSIRCVVRVLVIDNDPETRGQLLKILRGVKYDVRVAEGQGAELRKSAKSLALEFKPHVVIMDLRLADEHADDRSGLELWKDESFSSARCILYSAYLVQNYKVTREALMQEGVRDVVGKEDSPQTLIDAVERIARESCGCRNGLSIAWPAAWNEKTVIGYLFDEKETIPHDLVMDVFGRLFPDTKSLTLKTLDGSSQSSVITGHGRTILFQGWPDDREPVVVKLAPRRRIFREAKAYNDFIRDRLGGRFYAELQRSTLFWDIGGICYTFMGSSKKSLKTFTTFYRDTGNAKSVIKPLKHFFEDVWWRRYKDSHALQAENLLKAYDPSNKLIQRLESFSDQRNKLTFLGIPGEFENPVHWIPRHEVDSLFPYAKQATIHGDLHGDNLFIDDDHAWAIDFEHSCTGHVLRDFVEIEQDIVTRLIEIPNDDLRLFYFLVIPLTRPTFPEELIVIPDYLQNNQEIKKGLEVISYLRSIALEVTGFEDMREYYWGLLLDTCFSLVLSDVHSSRWWRCLLLSSILCTRLKEWGKRLPLAGWLPTDVEYDDCVIHKPGKSIGNCLPEQRPGDNVTNIFVNGSIQGSQIASGNNAVLTQKIQDSFNKAAAADAQQELKATLKQLADAVATMNKSLPAEHAAEVIEDLAKLMNEVTQPKPNKEWYSVSVDGLVKAAENLGKIGEPVVKLAGKVLALLASG